MGGGARAAGAGGTCAGRGAGAGGATATARRGPPAGAPRRPPASLRARSLVPVPGRAGHAAAAATAWPAARRTPRVTARPARRCLVTLLLTAGAGAVPARRHGAQEAKGGGGAEDMVLLLRPHLQRRDDAHPAPEGQALQVHYLPPQAQHRLRLGHPLHASAQAARPLVRPVARARPWPCAGRACGWARHTQPRTLQGAERQAWQGVHGVRDLRHGGHTRGHAARRGAAY